MREKSEFARQDIEREWRSLTITDDYIFGRVFSQPDLCGRLIEILLGVRVSSLAVPPEYQKTLQAGIGSRGVRFDVYTETDGEAFDIEIQTTRQTDLPLRMRYYQSSMDTALVRRGQPFSDLKRSYVLFISTVDQFGYGEPVYEIESAVKGHPEYKFDDKRKEVVYNISAYSKSKNEEIRSLLKYMATGEVSMDFSKEVARKVEEVKDDEYWRNNYISIQMWKMDAIREGLAEGMKQGMKEGMKQGMMQGMKEGMKQGMDRGIKEGIQQGAARQKAEDEKLILAERELLSQKDSLIYAKDAEIAKLKHQLKEALAIHSQG